MRRSARVLASMPRSALSTRPSAALLGGNDMDARDMGEPRLQHVRMLPRRADAEPVVVRSRSAGGLPAPT